MPDGSTPAPDGSHAAARSLLLDTPPEEAFDRLTRLAARLLRAPVALVTLLDVDRQFFKSQVGLPDAFASARQTPLSHSFCQHVVRTNAPLVIEDAREDAQLRDNLAIPDLGVVAYAGVPLLDPAGRVLGSFCVTDHKPRRWTDEELLNLRDLAAAVTAEIGLREELHRAAAAEDALRQSESRFRTLAESASDGIITVAGDDRILYANPALARMLGYNDAELVGQSLTVLMPPSVRDAHRAGMSRYLETGKRNIPWDGIQLPALHRDGRELLVEVSFGEGVQNGERVFTGMMRDVTERERAEAAVRRSEESIRRLYTIAARQGESAEDKIAALLELGCERFGLPTGMLSYIEDDRFTVEALRSPHPDLHPGQPFDLDQTYCSETVWARRPLAFTHVDGTERAAHPWHRKMGSEAYIGAPVWVAEQIYGTLSFLAPDPLPREFSPGDREFVQLMAQWVGGELERRSAEQVERQLAAERAARAAADNARLRIQAVLESIGDAFFALDEQARFTYINRVARAFFVEITDRKPVEMLGKNVWDVFPEMASGPFQNIILSTRDRRETREFEYFFAPIDRWLELRIYPTERGSSVYFRDITERKLDEEALRESENRFHAVFDDAAIGMALVDMEGHPLEANRALQEILGYSGEELRTLTFGAFTHPDDLESGWELFGKLVAGERDAYRIEKRYLRKDGSLFWGALTLSLVRDGKGAPQFAVGMVENITERKIAEEALQESQTQLFQSQKMESVGRLAGGIAHDFNNLLTVITGNAELMRPSLPEGSAELEDLTEIARAAQRAAALTRQLLAFSRQEVADAKPLDLNELVQGVDKLLRRVIGEDVELKLRLSTAPAIMEADAGQMEQVLVNLAVNARDAMPGGGTITIETQHLLVDAAPSLRYPSLGVGSYIQLGVTDTGVGMDEATALRIFEPFFTTKEIGKGTGLGLSTVYGIVRQSGGEIVAHSTPGEGTRFDLFFPRTETVPELAEPLAPASAATGTGAILLVEDDDDVRAITARILTRAGYQILSAPDGETALQTAADHKSQFDLVVTDMVMPGMSGRELIARLQAIYPDVRCLVMTGYTRDRADLEAISANPDVELLHKPFRPDDLIHAVRTCLQAAPSDA